MQSSIVKLSQQLLAQIDSTSVLKNVSQTLESLSQNRHFKNHTHGIVSDATLTKAQKQTQLAYLIRSFEEPVLYDFFSSCIMHQEFWLFQSGKLNYFDRFVQEFQQQTENVKIISFTTALPLTDKSAHAIVKDLSDFFGHQVVISHKINPALIGGVQLSFENLVYDYSVRSKFRQFEREWIKTLQTTEKELGQHFFDT